uniref:Transmembrane protein 88 n=1 Tax=Gopherus evgoodei TaxID=1825980 RepID=A0A8C5EZY3_9SAUR
GRGDIAALGFLRGGWTPPPAPWSCWMLWVVPAQGPSRNVKFPAFLHARVAPCEAHLHDAGATALLVLGFTLLLPLLVLGLAAFVRLARRLQLGYCLLPYSLAVYRNLPAGRYHQAAWCCPRARAPAPADKVWV